MANEVIGDQAPLYVSGTRVNGVWYNYDPETGVDNRITEFAYTDNINDANRRYMLSIGGGSGTGSLHFKVKNVTGSGTIDSQGRFTFLTPGTVWVEVYKDGSAFSQYPDTGEAVNGYYSQSKTLVVGLTLDTTTVKIIVTADVTLNIGESIPSESSLQGRYTVEYTNKNNFPGALSRVPEIYFVYDSDDFYKFDVMCEANSEDGYNNGIKYRKNPDGTWNVTGTASDVSEYNLIVSTSELPSYLVRGREYKLTKNTGTVKLITTWYHEVGDPTNITYTSSTQSTIVTVPSDAIGAWFKLQVSSGVTTDVDLELHLYDLEERKMDNLHEGEYPIAGRYAQVSDTNKYTKKIQYRSAKLKFVNTKYYRIYTDYDEDLGDVEVNYRRAKPYTEVMFTVKAKPGAMYTTGTGSSEQPNITIDGVNDYELIGSVDRDSQNRMIQSSYRFTMPISTVTIKVNFINIADSEDIPYGDYPYIDAGYGSRFEISFDSKIYADALVFCKYARYVYFGESFEDGVPLMTGTIPGLFYEPAEDGEAQTEENLYLRRRDMISVLRRISHGTFGFPEDYYPKPASEYGSEYNAANVARHPDEWFYAHSKHINTPEARLYTYAGYPPESGQDVQSTDTAAEFSDTALANYATSGSGANDDYLQNYNRIQDIAWNTWVGTTSGYNDKSYAPKSSATFQEAASVLWRYAKFRQFDIMGHGSDYTDADDSDAAYWAQHGPIKWAISRGILPKRRMSYKINGHQASTSGRKIHPDDFINRAEYAYMIMKFCQLYAW